MIPSQSSSAPLQASAGAGPQSPQRLATPSSTAPSQSLSMSSQVSSPVQNPQRFDPVAQRSSVSPSQSSSAPLQTSGMGRTEPAHALHSANSTPVHVCVPPVQAPTPSVPSGPP